MVTDVYVGKQRRKYGSLGKTVLQYTLSAEFIYLMGGIFGACRPTTSSGGHTQCHLCRQCRLHAFLAHIRPIVSFFGVIYFQNAIQTNIVVRVRSLLPMMTIYN